MPTVCCTSSGHGGEAEGQGPVSRTRSAGSVPRRRALGSCKRPNTHRVATTLGNMWWEGETFVASKEHPVREHSRPPLPPHWERTGTTAQRQRLQEDIADHHQHTQHHRALPQNVTGPARRASGGTTPTTKTAAQTDYRRHFRSFPSLPVVDTCDTITPYRTFVYFFPRVARLFD